MGKLRWYKRDPDAALSGMIGLTAEERGYYNTLIDLLYARDLNVTDEIVIRAVGGRPQTWRRVKASLITKGKIRVMSDGKLNANGVERVWITSTEQIETGSKPGVNSGLKPGFSENSSMKSMLPIGRTRRENIDSSSIYSHEEKEQKEVVNNQECNDRPAVVPRSERETLAELKARYGPTWGLKTMDGD